MELVKSKQDLGEALNTVYEYEQTAADKELMRQIQENMTFNEEPGRGDGENESADSNSSNS